MGHKSLSAVPNGLVVACIGKTGFFFHRQRVKFGAHHDGGTVTIPVDGYQAGLADLLGDLETERAHFGGQPGCGLHLLKGEFRMRMNLLVERIEIWVVGFDRFFDRGRETSHIDFRVCGQKGCRAQRNGRQQRFGKSVHGNDAP